MIPPTTLRRITPSMRAEAIALSSRCPMPMGITTLRANGAKIEGPDVDAMLARAVARERVELELDLLAYEQGARDSDGVRIPNRNHVRFRDGVMQRLGRSGRGVPFLRDHRQHDSEARSGTVIDSRTEKVGETNHYRIYQTVRLSDPAAVERALRGLMTTVSIGWHPTGDPHCTSCKAPIFTECLHFPGDLDDEGGRVEWEHQDAELIETSEVPVPGVPTAGIDGIRAALAATLSRGEGPQEIAIMKVGAIATLLNLAATASEDEITVAVTALATERDAIKEQLSSTARALAAANAKLATHEADAARVAEDAWIADGIKGGKVRPGAHELALRAYFKSDPGAARAMLDASPVVTPVGMPSQAAAGVGGPAPVTPITEARRVLSQVVNYDGARGFAKLFGAKDPDAALARLVENEGE
jgi:hypothetical protein